MIMGEEQSNYLLDEDFQFQPSNLGQKEYWEKVYKSELENFESNGDIGDIWFGEDSVIRIINWMQQSDLVSETSSILDVGCGNGITLSYLADEGFVNLYGVDYSSEAIELAKSVAHKRETAVTYEVGDVVNKSCQCVILSHKYDICHDKGTYDAISLMPDRPKEKMKLYLNNIWDLTNDDGLFIITSCNWTGEELMAQFNEYFTKVHVIPTPTFMFGGVVGSSTTSLVLKKRRKKFNDNIEI